MNRTMADLVGAPVEAVVAGHLLEQCCPPPNWLTLEITESVLMQNPAAAAETMARLANIGVQLAIDDFRDRVFESGELEAFCRSTV